MDVNLITITPDAEKMIAYMARVSSPYQDNPEYVQLLRYLLDRNHWSPYEMCHAVIEINTSRAIAAQILRHRSFSFQEFSQRYAQSSDMPELAVGRKQSAKNRQSSTDDLPADTQDRWVDLQIDTYRDCWAAYQEALDLGVAREQARMLLPLATPTRLYMSGTLRSWLHYVSLRTQPDTQQEHRVIAEQCRDILAQHLPVTAEVLGWRHD